jgi:hypothetical protein
MAGGPVRVDEHQYLTRQGVGVNISIESEASANPAGHFYPRCYSMLMWPVALERAMFLPPDALPMLQTDRLRSAFVRTQENAAGRGRRRPAARDGAA